MRNELLESRLGLARPMLQAQREKKASLRMQVSDGCVGAVLLSYGLGRPVITSEIGNCSVFVLLGWRFVFGIIMK